MRIAMLTYDRRVDRRIFQEAETLIDAGHEVLLLAGWREGLPVQETVGRVPVRRVDRGALPGQVGAAGDSILRAFELMLRRLLDPLRRGASRLGLGRLAGSLPDRMARLYYRYTRSLLNLLITIERRARQWSPEEPLILAYLEHLADYEPDIIHAHDLPLLEIAVRAKRRRPVPVVYDAHELFPHQPLMTRRRQAELQRLERRIIHAADCVFTVNPFLARHMERSYPGAQVAVIQNAVDAPEGFDISQRFNRFRQEYGLPAEKVLVLFQGGIAPGRNLEVAIQGMARVDDPRFVLLVMGYGDYVTDLRRLARRHGVDDRVIFVPSKPQDELLYYTASADIGLIPYPYGENLNTHYVSPNKLYEFVVAGLPILTNELPFTKMVVEEHGFGICHDLQTPEGFAEALARFPLEALPTFRANLLAHRGAFTWQSEAKKLLALYEPLTNGSVKPRRPRAGRPSRQAEGVAAHD